jgi:hypothetical protein
MPEKRQSVVNLPRVVGKRGPGYPTLSLEAAVKRVNQLRDANLARTTINASVACGMWGWSRAGTEARAVLASLIHYGLMNYLGRGEARQIQLTNLAHRIVFDQVPQSSERQAALRDAALHPTAFRQLWDKYGAHLPPDVALRTYLIRDRGFSDTGARNFTAAYRPTLAFAGLFPPDAMPPANQGGTEAETGRQESAPADLVQVGSDGVPANPDRDRAVHDHEGCRRVVVESGETGMPMDQAVLAGKGAGTPKEVPQDPASFDAQTRRERRSPEEIELLRGPLGVHASYRLLVSGGVGPKELGRLISILELQRNILAPEDGAAP